jgi:hypothetical protein
MNPTQLQTSKGQQQFTREMGTWTETEAHAGKDTWTDRHMLGHYMQINKCKDTDMNIYTGINGNRHTCTWTQTHGQIYMDIETHPDTYTH